MKILIIKTSSLGDVLHAFDVIDYLKEYFPDCEIDWVVEKLAAPLVQAHPHVNQTLEIDTKSWRHGKNLKTLLEKVKTLRKKNYDVIFDLQGNFKSALFTFLAKSKYKVGFSLKSVPEWINVIATNTRFTPEKGGNIRQDYLSLVQQYFKKKSSPSKALSLQFDDPVPDVNAQNALLVFPGAHWENKRFTPDEWAALLQNTKERVVIAWGNEEERQLAANIANQLGPRAALLPKCSLGALFKLMQQAKCVMAMDSLPLHLAALAGVPTKSFFGPTLASKYCPIGTEHESVQGNCPYGVVFTKRCPYLRTCKTAACMRDAALKAPDSFCESYFL